MLLHGLAGSSRYWERLAEVSCGYAATVADLLGQSASESSRQPVRRPKAAQNPHVRTTSRYVAAVSWIERRA